MRTSIALFLAAAIFIAAPAALAHEAGDFYVRVGGSNVDPDDPNGDIDLTGLEPITTGVQDINVDDAWSLTFTGSYQWTENWAVELLAAYPFEHDISVDTLGKVGSTKHLPPTLSLQYHFLPKGKFQPYVGAGVNYSIFFDDGAEGLVDEVGGDVEIEDNSFGLAGQVGFDYMFNDKWFVNLDFRYISIETKAKVTLPALQDSDIGLDFPGGTIKEDVDINPWVYGVNIGYKF
ncbi:MAG: OmpW family protein [Gammaproteobacteria bacterium]|nr:MAG: OmpW family protein [Gammaproteobacteria bacterium]